MISVSDESFEELKKICEKEGIKYKSESECHESANNLLRLFGALIEMEREEHARKKRLEKEPKGFSMAGEGRNCSLCGRDIHSEDGWYDKWGFKCLNCQDAINKRKIPGSLCRDYRHEKAIPDITLALELRVHIQKIRKLIREGKIIARPITNGPNMILKKDNPNLNEVLAELAK